MFKRKSFFNDLDDRPVSTRYNDGPLFKIDRPSSELYKKSIKYKGAVEWNSLRSTTRTITSLEAFKLLQKNWIQNTIASNT